MPVSEYIITAVEVLGTVAYAVSGAMAAIEKRADFFGVIFLACVTATGGGILRDMMLGCFPPRIFFDALNVTAALLTSVAVYFLARRWKDFYLGNTRAIDTIDNVFDALGLGAFTVMGVQIAIESGLEQNCPAALFMGMVTGIGGGLIRDTIVNEMPFVLKKRIYAVATLIGGLCYYLLLGSAGQTAAAFLSMGVTFAIRMLATHYRWNLPPAI
ncbi:MAG: trimeric intracellular cation channel family protein [Candidatus Heteroscillospira sp.]|jgi:uncharacterized membrane protein YeiH